MGAINYWKDWICDKEQIAAINVFIIVPVKTQGSGPDFAFVTLPELILYLC